jgi:hypothetical protein
VLFGDHGAAILVQPGLAIEEQALAEYLLHVERGAVGGERSPLLDSMRRLPVCVR